MISDPDVVHVDEFSFADEVQSSELPVFIDVSTEWCGPCRVAAPAVVELARRYRGRLKVVAIDGDASPRLTAELGVRGFPTFLGVVGGRVVSRRAGFGGKGPLDALASELIAAAGAPAGAVS
jgi:thioredoxin-like negative regulator of GroEL